MPLEMTDRIARAAGWDAGNRHAQTHGRAVWTEDDYQAAIDEYNRLWPEPLPVTPKE